jgi:MoaA/NifB/PqqE/SkfB family radical SAM enzyme
MRILPLPAYLPTILGLARNAAARRPVFPFYASFKLTSRCHFGCPFCNVRDERTPDLPTGPIKKILDNLSRSSVLMTSFEGGEPLLRSDIGELLRYARARSFYLLFTTSHKKLMEHPLEEYCRFIDFFHVSIDEGHDNLEMFDLLPRLAKLPTQLSVQTVVTADSIGALDEKVRACFGAGAAIVIIPATHMDNTRNVFPDIAALEKKIAGLRKKYPATIHTPTGYFDAYNNARCSAASIVIAPDGRLYYPCHIRGAKGPDLARVDLNAWLVSAEAKQRREEMRRCARNCGWYQYYSIDSYTHPATAIQSLVPMLFYGVRRKKTAKT